MTQFNEQTLEATIDKLKEDSPVGPYTLTYKLSAEEEMEVKKLVDEGTRTLRELLQSAATHRKEVAARIIHDWYMRELDDEAAVFAKRMCLGEDVVLRKPRTPAEIAEVEKVEKAHRAALLNSFGSLEEGYTMETYGTAQTFIMEDKPKRKRGKK